MIALTLSVSRRRMRDLERARSALTARDDTSPATIALLDAVSLRVHRRDTMYETGRGEHYLSVGLSALDCIERATQGDPTPTSVLDFAGGYGRVLRFLRARFPDARLAAADTERRAVMFCRRAFGVDAFHSSVQLQDVHIGSRFDLIWCGSLITHLNEPAADQLLGFFRRHLAEGGQCVFSAHGQVTERALSTQSNTYGLGAERCQKVLEDYQQHGFGYANYPGHSSYGISLTSREHLVGMAQGAGLAESSHQPSAWDDHHDVYGFRRA